MNTEDSSQNDGVASELESKLTDLMQQVYAQRHEEEQWQAVLKNAPDKLIEFLSDNAVLLSNVLTTDSPDKIEGLVHEVVAGIPSESSDAKQAKSDISGADHTEVEAGEKNTDSLSTTQAPKDNAQHQQDSESMSADKECSDEELVAFLTLVFKNKDRDDKKLGEILRQAEPEVLNRLDENAFYLHKVLAMTNENELHDFLQILSSDGGPAALTDEMMAAPPEGLDDDTIVMLLDNWAYIEFDCEVKNIENEQIQSSGMLDDPLQWMSTAGVGVTCVPADTPKVVTVSTSLQGALHGIDSSVEVEGADGNIETDFYGIQESPEKRKMLLAIDLIGFLKTSEMGNMKIRQGHRGLMRNVWAIGKVNNIVCAGFEPTPQEMAWYEKRSAYFADQFRVELENQLAQSPAMAPGGRISSNTGHEEHDIDIDDSDEDHESEGQGSEGVRSESHEPVGQEPQEDTKDESSSDQDGSVVSGQPDAGAKVKKDADEKPASDGTQAEDKTEDKD